MDLPQKSFVRPTFQALGMPIYMEKLCESFQSSTHSLWQNKFRLDTAALIRQNFHTSVLLFANMTTAVLHFTYFMKLKRYAHSPNNLFLTTASC